MLWLVIGSQSAVFVDEILGHLWYMYIVRDEFLIWVWNCRRIYVNKKINESWNCGSSGWFVLGWSQWSGHLENGNVYMYCVFVWLSYLACNSLPDPVRMPVVVHLQTKRHLAGFTQIPDLLLTWICWNKSGAWREKKMQSSGGMRLVEIALEED